MSVADPRHPVEAAKFDGEMLSKDVTVDATVRQPDGSSTRKTYVVTLQRVALKGPQGEINGRWIVTNMKEASTSGST